MKKFTLAITAILLLTSCGSVINNDLKPAKQKGAFFSTKSNVETTGDAVFKESKKVFIPVFRVAFAQDKSASGRAGGNKFSVNAKLKGLNEATYQKITNNAYNNFVKDLKAAGYEIIDISKVKASENYKQITKVENGYDVDSAIYGKVKFYAPAGYENIMIAGEEGAFSGLKALSGGSTQKLIPALMKEFDAPALTVTYVVDYLNTETSGGIWASTGSAEVGAGVSVRAGSNVTIFSRKILDCVGYCVDVMAKAELGQAIYSQEKFGELKDVTTGGEQAGQIALNLVTALAGVGTGGYRNVEMDVDAGKYSTIANGLINQTNEALISTIKSKN